MAKSIRKSEVVSKAAAKPRKPAAKKKAASLKVIQMPVSHEQIAQLAHRFWNDRGRVHGHDAEDWFRAEQMLRAKAS